MYNFRKLVLGYAPTRRFDFPEPKNAYENSLKIKQRVYRILEELGDIEIVDLSFLNEEGLLYQECDVQKVYEEFIKRKVDVLFMPHTNFGCEEVVVKLCRKMKLPVLIWGPRDEAPPGGYCYRQTDTQCGLFATTMGLLRENLPFSYIENCWLDSPVLDRDIEKFIRASSVVKALKNMKVGQIGPRPRDFLSEIVDEAALVSRLGIDVIPVDGTEFIYEIEQALKKNTDAVQDLVLETKHRFPMYTITQSNAEKLAAAELAILSLAQKYGFTVAAGDCWYSMKLAYEANPCFAFGNLTAKGLPVVCETDVYGAVTAGIMAAVSRNETPSFTADMTIRHPENENAELLWHCGPFPRELAKEQCIPELNDGCMGRYEIKGGDITIARLGSLNGEFRLFFGEGKGVEGPATGGNYVWFEVNNWTDWEKKLMYGPYIHHTCGIHGKYAEALKEACRYLNIKAEQAE